MRPPSASSSSSVAAAAATAPSSPSAAPRATTRRALLLSTSPLTLAAVVPAVVQAAANPFSTPYSQSRTLQLGLDTNGKIRTCPSTNPGCVCTNPTVGASSSVASPLIIPESTTADAAAQLLRQAILKTQKNVSFNVDQQTPHGQYIQAEVDGGFGRDVIEFLVKKDAGVVAYRCVATKVTFVYPFTTAVGDSRGQEQRVAAVAQELGWKIRTCPSTNPGCVCTNPTVGASSSVASQLIIPESTSADAAAQLLRQAILKTQKNVSFNVDQQTPHGQYIQAEVDGGFGRDVIEFLVKKDAGVVAYRCVATKVTFVYPFTTAVGDSRGQEQRVAAVAQEHGWYAPDIRSSVDDVAT